jgi:hypothetical protein
MLTAADQFAGQVMKCPHCGNTFTAPALPKAPTPSTAPAATPATAGEASPSAGAPPREDIFLSSPATSTASAESAPSGTAGPRPTTDQPPPVSPLPVSAGPQAGYRRTYTIWISPRVVPWVAPVCLVVVFMFTFFSWLNTRIPGLGVRGDSAWTIAFGQGNALLIVYLLLLVLALLVAPASVILPRLSITLPPAVQQIMPWRSGIVTGAILLAFLFLFLQLLKGFSEEAGEMAAFDVYRTAWLKLAVSLHLLAAVAAGLEFWLVLRRTRPLPRIDVSW